MLPANHPLRATTDLAKAIALPGEVSPVRYPSFPALERTATLGFSAPNTLAISQNGGDSQRVILFRQAAYPSWATQLTWSLVSWGATYVSQQPASTTQHTQVYSLRNCMTKLLSGNQTAGPNAYGISGAATVPSGYSLIGVDAGTGPDQFIYVPGESGGSLYTAISSTLAASVGTKYALTLEIWDSPGEVRTVVINGNKPTANDLSVLMAYSPAINTWIRPVMITIRDCAAPITDIYVTAFTGAFGNQTYAGSTTTFGSSNISGGHTILAPLATPYEFGKSQLPWYSTRVTSSALLMTNVAAVMSKEGAFIAGRASPSVQSAFTITKAYVNTLHPAEKTFRALETGMYTYCPPSTDMALFNDYTINTGSGLAPTPVFRLDNDAMYNVAFLGPTSTYSMSFAITTYWNIEFRTSSALFDIGYSTMTLESLHQAQIALAQLGFFFENPDHKKLAEKLRGYLKQYGPTAYKILDMANPAVGGFARMAGEALLSRRGNEPPHTTTLKVEQRSDNQPRQKAKPKEKAARKETKEQPQPKPKR